MYTADQIADLVAYGRSAVAQAFSDYYDGRKAGKYCEGDWIRIGFLNSLIESINGFDPDDEDSFTITAAQVYSMSLVIEEVIVQVVPIKWSSDWSAVYRLAQDDRNDCILQEDGYFINWK